MKAELLITAEHLGIWGHCTRAEAANWGGDIRIARNLGAVRFRGDLRATGSIHAEAGTGIVAGGGIEAGGGITAGLSVTAKWASARLRIFVGACPWRLPKPEECELRAELRGGTLAYGTHVPPATKENER